MKEPVIRTLLIDDDEDEFVIMREFLAASGSGPAFHLDWEPDYDRALDALRRHQHDVYLVDYRLGERTGLDLLNEAPGGRTGRAVIMLTGAGGDEVDQAALKAGVFDYLVKGEFSDHEIRRSIRYAFERSLIETELRSQAQILANVHDGVCLIDVSGAIRTWNRGGETLFGYRPEQIVGKPIASIIARADRTRFLDRISAMNLESFPTDFTCMGLHLNGSHICIAVRASLLRNEAGEFEGAIICANDITEQKKLEQLVLTISENEQRRIGQDLHDDLCQQLAGIACLTKLLERRVALADPGCAEEVDRISGMVVRASSRAREIARGLVPAKLAADGLISALEEIAEQTQRAFGMECRLTHSRNLCVKDSQVASHIYRIVQEAVSNAVRHGKAKKIIANLVQQGDQLLLTIQDNGSGMSIRDTLKSNAGLGISTMTHRAHMLGGDLKITSSPGDGLLISCSIPYPAQS